MQSNRCEVCGARWGMGDNQWISVLSRFPDEKTDVLMSYNNFVLEGYYMNEKFYHPSNCAHVENYCFCHEQEGVTHWMPLPAAPKDE